MQYFTSKLFVYNDRKAQSQSSATITSSLYHVTFNSDTKRQRSQQAQNINNCTKSQPDIAAKCEHNIKKSSTVNLSKSQVEISSQTPKSAISILNQIANQARVKFTKQRSKHRNLNRSLCASFSSATETCSYSEDDDSTRPETVSLVELRNRLQEDNTFELKEDGEWLVVEPDDTSQQISPTQETPTSNEESHNQVIEIDEQMALDIADVEIIKTSWEPIRNDPTESGLLLFKGLFTKFPQYKSLFSAFQDVELDHMYKHKRILHHVTQVISAVTYLVDMLGDETQASKLDETLVGLARAHIDRNVCTAEFRDLGIVLLDFVSSYNCGNSASYDDDQDDIEKSSRDIADELTTDTMTSALDRIRAAASPSYKDADHLLMQTNHDITSTTVDDSLEKTHRHNEDKTLQRRNSPSLDHSHLVAAWTKLYNIILEVVQNEATKSGRA